MAAASGTASICCSGSRCVAIDRLRQCFDSAVIVVANSGSGREAMMTWRFSTGAFLLFLLMARVPAQGKQIRATLLYDGQTTEISTADEDAGQLWITTADLKRATRFELK